MTIWSFQVLNRVLYLWQAEAPKKGAWMYFFSKSVCISNGKYYHFKFQRSQNTNFVFLASFLTWESYATEKTKLQRTVYLFQWQLEPHQSYWTVLYLLINYDVMWRHQVSKSNERKWWHHNCDCVTYQFAIPFMNWTFWRDKLEVLDFLSNGLLKLE